jgi:HlyD family secretion protein
MSENPLFRKAAIDKLSSPERLDVLMQVTSPNGWIALWTIGAILIGVIVWSVLGSIPTRVQASGILIRGGTLREIRSSGPGELTKFTLHVGDAVKADQVVGELTQSGSQEQIKAQQGKYQDLAREASTGEAEDRATIAGMRADMTASQAEIRNLQAELERAREDLAQKNASLAKGLITKQRVTQAERDVLQLQGQVATKQAQIRSQDANIRAVEQRIRGRQSAAESVKLDITRLQNSATQSAQLRSPAAGRVVEVKKSQGDGVATGEVLAVLEPESAEMEPVVYVPSTSGKQIKPGMEAQISPTTVKREEFGFMKGTISYIGEYPVTPQAVTSVIANQALAQELLGNSAKLEMRAALVPDKGTTSGYAWSSSGGPNFKILSGTRVNIDVVTERKAPITYVLPTLRKMLGGA